MAGDARILTLRTLLAEKFPAVSPKAGGRLVTGIAALDEQLGGGFSRTGITELCGASRSSGAGLVLITLLASMARLNQHMGLIDGSDTFDPQPLCDGILGHLLWVRCQSVSQALKATDLLFRDGNLPLVVMDLRSNDEKQLRKVPSTTWYRFQRIAEQGTTALVVLTPRAMVNSAEVRVQISAQLKLDDLEKEHEELVTKLEFDLIRSQSFAGRREEAV
jgi:hypothetical protein